MRLVKVRKNGYTKQHNINLFTEYIHVLHKYDLQFFLYLNEH